jgi:hypothetical protein
MADNLFGRSAPSPPRTPCLSGEVIACYGLNFASEAVRIKVDAHVKNCGKCLAKLRALLEELDAEFGPASEEAPTSEEEG